MKRIPLLLLLMMTWIELDAAHAMADSVVVVVSRSLGLTAMTRKQVTDIYLGRSLHLPSGEVAQPLDSGNDMLRGNFFKDLTGKPVALYDAYWARLYFAGQQAPPRKLASDAEVLSVVQRQPGAIGFVSPTSLNGSEPVSIVLRLE